MINTERIYTLKLTEEQFRTARNCLSEFERMAKQKVMRKLDQGERVPNEVIELLPKLSEVNDLIYAERIRVEHLG